MSTVGLYDMDLVTLENVLPNLEIMKLSQYYSEKYILTKFTQKFNPEKYTTFYIRKDYNDHNFPASIFQNNINLGGYAFTNGLYVPLNENIEKVKPNTEIYIPFIKSFSKKITWQQFYASILRGQHLRLSLDGFSLWPNFECQLKDKLRSHYMIYHDYNINNIENIRDLIKDQLKQRLSLKFGVKFPVQIKDENDLIWWTKIPIIDNCFGLQYNGLMKDELWYEYINRREWRHGYKDLVYNVTYNCPSQEIFIKDWLPKIYKQLIFSRMNRVRILLKYDDHFFIDKRWRKVFQLLQLYIELNLSIRLDDTLNTMHRESCSMYGFVKKLYDIRVKQIPLNKVDAREIFIFIKEQNFQLFDDFYQIAKVKLQGDEFIDDTIGH